MIHSIKIFNNFQIKDSLLCLDNSLFFDLRKVSFISDELISSKPIMETDSNSVLIFSFKFVIDGIMYDIQDNFTIEFNEKEVPPKMDKIYPTLKVFALRQEIVKIFIS